MHNHYLTVLKSNRSIKKRILMISDRSVGILNDMAISSYQSNRVSASCPTLSDASCRLHDKPPLTGF